MASKLPKSIGVFTFARSTKNTHVYTRFNPDTQRDEPQYVHKNHFDGEPPEEIEVFIKW